MDMSQPGSSLSVRRFLSSLYLRARLGGTSAFTFPLVSPFCLAGPRFYTLRSAHRRAHAKVAPSSDGIRRITNIMLNILSISSMRIGPMHYMLICYQMLCRGGPILTRNRARPPPAPGPIAPPCMSRSTHIEGVKNGRPTP
jgi:hypothetical protein